MAGTIFVINPNATEAVTEGIRAAVAGLGLPVAVECLTLAAGPAAVQTQRDIDQAVPALCALVPQLEARAAAFVIACFSDPGLYSVREITGKPVLGISECGMLTAMTLGQRVGVVSILAGSVPRHLRYFAAMGIASRVVADLPIDLGVLELADEARALARMIEVGRRLRDAHGAEVVVMGCAGMSRFRDRLEQAIGIPVVEPTLAAVGMAMGRAALGWRAPR
jgi:Asp/Glu/hydantoin racemase